jgi:glycosyltransferase involved in cell wall biosynthesis
VNPKKTKIFYLITKGNFGGAQRYVFELAKHLPLNSFEVTVIMGEGKELKQKLERAHIKVRQLETLKRDVDINADWQTFKTLFKILRQEKPDIIHLNSSKIGGLGALAGRLAGVSKIIFTAHGWAFNEKRTWMAKRVILFFHWLTIILCHQIIAVSIQTKKDIEKLPLTKNKIAVIYNGLDGTKFFNRFVARRELFNYFPQETKQIEKTANSLQTKFWIGTISELHPNKGLDILLEAFANVLRKTLGSSLGWSLILVIIGEGEERMRLQKFIHDKRLEDRIFLLGQVPDARNYLKAFDIFTLTSRTEALPYAILEAGAAGLPIVASEVGGIPEIIPGPEYGILTPPENIKEIEKSLLYMLKKPDYRKLTINNLKKKISNNFSLKKMVIRTIELYQE